MHERGFSLIETLVALAVFSTAAIGLLAMNTQSVTHAGALEERFLARTVAENRLVDAMTSPAARTIGTRSGEDLQMNRSFQWTETIAATERNGLVQITVDVTAPDQQQVLARVSALKRVTP